MHSFRIASALVATAALGCRATGGRVDADAGQICDKRVIVISEDPVTGPAPLALALTAAGFRVTSGATPTSDYDGEHPPLAGFDALVLIGGVQQGPVPTDMPAAGQQAIVDFVNAGHGLVMAEWAAFHVAAQPDARWQTLKPLVLLQRERSYSGLVTWQVDATQTRHPVWQGLPVFFTFNSVSNLGSVVPGPGVTRLAFSPQAHDAVAVRDSTSGRVVHLAHAGNHVPGGWMNANIQKLMSNAVGWVTRCR